MVLAGGLVVAQALSLINTSTTLLFAIVIGIIMLPLVFVDPMHGLMVYALVAPFSPEGFLGMDGIRVQDPLLIPIVFGVFVQQIRVSTLTPRLTLKRTLVAYVIFALVTTAIGMIVPILNRPARPEYALKLFQYVALTFCAALTIRNRRHVGMLLIAVVIGLLLQAVQMQIKPDRAVFTRLMGDAMSEQANVLGVYVTVVIALLLGCLDRLKRPLLRVGLLAVLAMAAYACLQTKSRTGYSCMIAVFVAALFLMRHKWLPVISLLAGTVVLIMRDDFFSRLSSIGVIFGLNADSSYEARLNAYKTIWRYISARPDTLWIGGGRGTYTLNFADTQWGTELLYGGLIGIIIFGILTLAFLLRSLRVWYACRERDDMIGAASVGCALVAVVGFVSAFGLASWSAIRSAEIIFLAIGLLMAVQRILDMEEVVHRKPGASALGAAPLPEPAHAGPASSP